MRTRWRAVAVLVVTMMVGGIGASGAWAVSNPTWSTLCAGYSGRTWYVGGIGYASTTASDNDTVGAAVRYYGGRTACTTRAHHAERSRAAVQTGGYHQSYCGWTQTHVSSL
ncbi:MAG TPA: hypothetical protein VGC67_15475 [Cellulomonas sp.]